MANRVLRGAGAAALAGTITLSGCGGGAETHNLGEAVEVGYAETTDTGARGPATKLGITVLDVREGSQEELTAGGYEVDEEARDSTPFYVHVRYENQGRETVTRNLDVGLEDSDGNLLGRTLIFNYGDEPFEPCERITEGTLEPGESYESCSLFLVPQGVEVARVSFLSDMGPDTPPEFVYWATE